MIDLDLDLQIRMQADGSATLSYVHDVLNATGEDRGGLPQREVWFEHTTSLEVRSLKGSEFEATRIKMVHNAGHILKFLPRFLRPFSHGSVGRVGYDVLGGSFAEDHYWSQSFTRHTCSYTVSLFSERALEWAEAFRRNIYGDESEISHGLEMQEGVAGTSVVVRCHHLAPGEVVTLRWADAS